MDTNVLIVGAGPIGLELAAALKQARVDYIHVDAGQIGQTITWYPRQVRFFSSPDRIAICGVPLQTVDQAKATREEYLAYLRGVVAQFDLQVNTYERVVDVQRIDEDGHRFHVMTRRGGEQRSYRCRHLVLAIGDMHRPRLLHIPGEDLPHVSHYFEEPHRYFQTKLLIVGGRNSAVEAALRCHHAGASVTLSYRRDSFDESSVKYWLTPEIRLLVDTGQIAFHPRTVPNRIKPDAVRLKHLDTGVVTDVDADFVLLLTGYEIDPTLFNAVGVETEDENHAPLVDEATMQTSVPGCYIAGTAAAGTQIRFRFFIENCHIHVARIFEHITGKPAPAYARNRTNAALAQQQRIAPET